MRIRRLNVIIILLLLCSHLFAAYYEKEISLRGYWSFMIGDDPSYAKVDFDDSDWIKIHVPDNWEEEGFPGYDGYAWYRVHFNLPAEINDKTLYLNLGQIDAVDESYLNGQKIGNTGEFEPEYKTAWTKKRIYALPKSILKFGEENVIAVKVFDQKGPGGIYSGNVGIYSKRSPKMLVEFSSKWKFSPGDNSEWSRVDFNDEQWDEVNVPSTWELQGYPLLDGLAWYRKTVYIPSDIQKGHLILSLGMIDDEDEVFFNGVHIGGTGSMDSRSKKWNSNDHWKKERFYYIPKSLTKPGKKNVIAIRVYDRRGVGGLYQDNTGIVTQKEYLSYRRHRKSSNRKVKEILEVIFEGIFD